MSYKPRVAEPGFRFRDACHSDPIQACIVCAVNEDGTANLVVFNCECDATVMKNCVLVQADEDGCPCYFTDPEPVKK